MSLLVEDLSVAGPQGRIVRDVAIAAAPGTPLTLIGETGSGKSLVAAAIMGTLPPGLSATGRIRLERTELLDLPPTARRALWGRRIALLPQEPWLSLDPTMPAASQVREVFGLVRGEAPAAARQGATRLLTALGLRAPAAARYPFQLSGGMAQRVAIAATQAAGASLLLADEPTKGLDEALRDDLAAMLRARAAEATVLTITHDIALARMLGGTVAVMLEGCVIESGPVAEVLDAPRHAYTRRLVDADPSRWPSPPPVAPGAAVVVAGRGLARGFGTRRLFAGLDIDVRAGEFVAVSGPSGCGKTTLGNVLLGLLRPEAGSVTRADAAPTRFQKLYQDPPAAFAPHATLRTALADLARRHGIAWARIAPLLAKLRLAPALLDRLPGQISGGELQRFALARVLLLDPLFLFADEATSRLDPITQQEVMDLLRAQVEERGLGVLLVTHETALARAMATQHVTLGAADTETAAAGEPVAAAA